MTLRARHVVEGTISGLHRSPFHGFNVEFAEYREYSPGDDLRRLDWRVLGRTDRFYVKQYEEESNLRATLVLDCSASMRYGSGPLNKFEYAATAAASLATLLVEQQDPVGLALFDNQTREIAAAGGHAGPVGPDHGPAGSRPSPIAQTELGSVLQTLSEQIKKRGLVDRILRPADRSGRVLRRAAAAAIPGPRDHRVPRARSRRDSSCRSTTW